MPKLEENLNHVLDRYAQMVHAWQLKYKMPDNVVNALKLMATKWQKGIKASRASYIIPVGKKISILQNRVPGRDIPDIESLLISLDVVINTLDDTVDVLAETKKDKWEREIIKIINFLNIFVELNQVIDNSQSRALILDNTFNFIISLTQIPFTEKEYSRKILAAQSLEMERDIAMQCLWDRAQDVNIFTQLLIFYFNIDSSYGEILGKTIRSYRALELFCKDYFDIDTDKKEQSNTPVLSLLEKHGHQKEGLRKVLIDIQDRLYSKLQKNLLQNEVGELLIELGQEKYKDLAQKIKI